MDSLKHQIWKFCKAQLSAQVASVFDFAVSLFFAEVVGIWYVYSTFIGALSGGILNCIVNYRWVFNAIGLNKKHVAIKYFMVWTGSILLNTGGTYLLTEFSKSYFAYSKIVVAVIVGLLWNYTMQNFFVYRDIHLAEKMRRTGKKKSHLQQFKTNNKINT